MYPKVSNSICIEEERVHTAPALGSDGGDTLIDEVPYDHLYRALVTYAFQQLLLVKGPEAGPLYLADGLTKLPRRQSAETEETLPIIRRLRAGDITVLEDEWDFFDWDEIAADFNRFFVFARHGEWPRYEPGDSHTEIEFWLTHFRKVVADPSIKAAQIPHFEWLTDTLAAAEGRWAIDHGRSVAPDDLAALAGVKLKTVANLIAAGQVPTDADGRVPAAEAFRYVERRKNFARSSWQAPVVSNAPTGYAVEQRALPEQVFVPVDGEGNAFLPSLARRSRDGGLRYAIGEKADPEYVEDYWQALERLARMPTPRWRRPNASGKGGWGLVSAQEGWRRFARVDLERMVTAARDA